MESQWVRPHLHNVSLEATQNTDDFRKLDSTFGKLASTYPYLYKMCKQDSHGFFMDIYKSILSHHLEDCHSHSPTSLLRRGLTDGSCFTLANRLHYADHTAGLQGGLKPVGGVLHIGHVNAQAAILTQQNHCCPLLLVAGCVPNGNHVLDLDGDKGGC